MDRSKTTTISAKYGFVLTEILLLTVVTAFAYSNIINNQFVFDDYRIFRSPHIRLTTLNVSDVADAWQKSLPRTRPVANVSFALNYFFHQYHVAGYHLVNIFIHIITGLFLYFLIRTTLNLPSLRSGKSYSRWLPFLAALFWLIHPVQTQSVTYTVQRMNSMAAMFYLISFFAYVQGRLARKRLFKVVLFGGCTAAWLLALGSKEIAVTLPFFIVLYDWYFLEDLNLGWLKRYWQPVFAAFLVLLLLAVFLYYGDNPFSSLLAGYNMREFTLAERLLTETRVVIFYLSLLIFPYPGRLNLDHDFALSSSLLAPLATVLSLLCLGLLLAAAILLARRHRLLSFAIIWFLGNLVVESTVIPLEIIFEHRLYLPSMLVVLVLIVGLSEFITNRHVNLAVAVLLVFTFTFWTYQRNQVWKDEVSLWTDCVKKSPGKARIHNNLGIALFKGGNKGEAFVHFQKAVKLNPRSSLAYNNLGFYWANRGDFKKAEIRFLQALKLNPREGGTSYSLGNLYMELGKVGLAKKYYLRAIELHGHQNSYLAKAYYTLAGIYEIEGQQDSAKEVYFKAIEFDPRYYAAYNSLVALLQSRGEMREAFGVLSAAVKLFPGDKELLTSLKRVKAGLFSGSNVSPNLR